MASDADTGLLLGGVLLQFCEVFKQNFSPNRWGASQLKSLPK